MLRALVAVTACVVGFTMVPQPSDAQDAIRPADANKAMLDQIKKDPDDVAALQAYMNSVVREVARGMTADPDGTLERLAEFELVAKGLTPGTPAAKGVVANMIGLAGAYRNHIRALQSPFAELERQVADIARTTGSDPASATAKLDALKSDLAKAVGSDLGKAHKEILDYITRTVAELERPLSAQRKLTEMIGKEAAPLKVEAWINGSPLTDKDLQGKVVLLDFWAVWCGPCIATFPHLREWHEKFADKGLVIIGLTGYYNFKWDDESKRAVRSQDEVSKADERAMLAKFAESHNLMHRFAITADDSLAEYYGVTGIPHVVVIDREGKIRLMKVGSGGDTASAISDMLEKLIAEK